MNRNDIRATALGFTGGLTAAFGTFAVVELGLETKALDAIRRWRLSAVERAEYDAIRQAQTDKYAAADRRREQVQAEIRAKFRPGLLEFCPKVPPELSELSFDALISETRYAKARKREEIRAARHSIGNAEIEKWTDQIAALRSEFARRDDEPMPFLDRARFNAVRHAVTSFDDEWPPLGTYGPAAEWSDTAADEAQTIDAGDPLATFPPYPDFSGPAALS